MPLPNEHIIEHIEFALRLDNAKQYRPSGKDYNGQFYSSGPSLI